jgi:hypothetical protein
MEKDKELRKDKNTEESKTDQDGTTGAAKAAAIDSIINSPSENVRSRMSGGTLGNTGTNISYEGPTAPGGGGSAGTGYSSGQDATGASLRTGVDENDTPVSRNEEQDVDSDERKNKDSNS